MNPRWTSKPQNESQFLTPRLCVYSMEIENNRDISIHVHVKILGMPMAVKLMTHLEVDPTDPTGTSFLEYFQGLEIAGVNVPIPSDWQRARPLEFSYMDETMLIARGNGGEPHYLKRD